MALILKRASACRPSGEWSHNDYDVLANGVVGRIFKANAAPIGVPWMWTLAFSRRARPRWPRSPRAGGRIDQLALLPLGQLILTTLSRESLQLREHVTRDEILAHRHDGIGLKAMLLRVDRQRQQRGAGED